jgi:hypothetical protein
MLENTKFRKLDHFLSSEEEGWVRERERERERERGTYSVGSLKELTLITISKLS